MSLANHAPAYVLGASQTISVCEDTSLYAINATLAIVDSDNGQLETWSVVLPPAHGTLAGSYSTFSSGGILTPTGLSYTPTAGYTGSDSFKVKISDGTAADTMTVYVTDTACGTTTIVATRSNEPGAMLLYPNPGNGKFTFRVAAPVTDEITVVITNLVGEQIKEFVTASNAQTAINISAPAGVYLVTATSAHGHWSGKLVITARQQ